ncbi:MBL fold metallo-hydrolase [Streptomonospora sp. S1-112]|uniref:MBL fold metallo-hydrolase n=1 Tax=Streptomonospora mangrovi TaxID=2883123 RepID=A0A9X3NJ88_9ACTN|nr:MBL fold metallo-hydrolase [Streptomonospora mangrovi]MDA0563041.1 MBL fold metallo-hydrolase [Streptomonospora mangrovi]
MRATPPVEDLGEGLWSVPVPIPGNPLGYTLVYVVEDPRGPVLVDAGWPHEDAWRALTEGLAAIGTGVAEVRGVVLTHFHPDHSGLAGRVREASGAWVALHEADAALVRRLRAHTPEEHRDLQADRLAEAGASPEEVARLRADPPRMAAPEPPDRELADGDLLDLARRKLRAVWTPGHSPGHICLHLEDADVLFTGDHVLPRITPHLGLYTLDTDEDPLTTYLGSLTGLAAVPATRALPAHEHRFSGPAARAGEIAAHHEDKLERLAALLNARPATLWDLSARLPWARPWADMGATARRMAAAETAAHLRTLERRGRARRTPAPGGAAGWTAPAPAPGPAPAP